MPCHAPFQHRTEPKAPFARKGNSPPRSQMDVRRSLPKPLGGRIAETLLQTKPSVSVGEADDPLELEADRIADRVMRMPIPEGNVSRGARRLAFGGTAPRRDSITAISLENLAGRAFSKAPRDGGTLIRRVCAACEEEKIKRKPDGATAPTTIPSALITGLGSGRPFGGAARSFMESRFGLDFGHIRIHEGAGADRAARSVQALAFTMGQNIVFRAGAYAPSSTSGKHLLAHELAHTIQQGPFVQRRAMEVQRALSDDGSSDLESVPTDTGVSELGFREDARNAFFKCVTNHGCSAIESCNGSTCAVFDCGKGSCQNPLCKALGMDNLLVRAWCAYRCVDGSSAIVFYTALGNFKLGPFCL